MKHVLVWVGCVVPAATVPAWAYIGPGVGATMIGWFVGFVLTMGAAAGALVVWPLRMLRSRRREGAPVEGEPEPARKPESGEPEQS